jgi:type IV secretion system protein VirB5
MPATHKNTAYKPPDLPNPFAHDSDKSYADILLDQMKSKRSWKTVAAFSLLLFLANLFFFIYAVKLQKTVPVLVNVMPSGESHYLGEVRQNGEIQVPEAAIQFQIRKFISNLRSVSTDYQILYDNIDECFFMVTSSFSPVLRQAIIANSPFDLVGQIRRTVEIESILTITARSYQVNWRETTLDASAAQKQARLRAVATVRLIPPSDATIKKNPLGIYIENFEMTEL